MHPHLNIDGNSFVNGLFGPVVYKCKKEVVLFILATTTSLFTYSTLYIFFMIAVYSAIPIHASSFKQKILIGQLSQSVCSTHSTVSNYVIFDVIPIKKNEVIVEQIECLTRILPPGLAVLGVACSSASNCHAIVELFSLLSECPHYCEFIYIQFTHNKLQVTLCSDSSVRAIFIDKQVSFCTLSCTVHAKLPLFPFLVMKERNLQQDILIDPQSTKCIPIQGNSHEIFSLLQLGSDSFHTQETMQRVSLVSSPLYLSGKSLHGCIARWLKHTKEGTDIVLVRSQRRPHLIYACQLCRRDSLGTILTQGEWQELEELVEDATDELVQCSQIIGFTVASNTSDEQQKVTGTARKFTRLIFLSTVVLIGFGVLYSTLFTRLLSKNSSKF